MACGGAVLASTAGSVREILPSNHPLLPPEDVSAWRNAIRAILEDEDYWALTRQGVIEHSRSFTWERCGEATRDVYHKVLSEKRAMAA